jgi:hypothetical protein
MHYRVLWDLRRVEDRLETLCREQEMGTDELESIRAFRMYLEQLDPELFLEIRGLIAEITEAVHLGLSGDPDDYEKALVLLEATALVNDLALPEDGLTPPEGP